MSKSLFYLSVLLLFGLTAVAGKAEAQPQAEIEAKTPEALANLVLQRFASGSAEEFSAVVPDPAADEVVARAIKEKSERRANLGLVISRGPARAVFLLTGTVVSIYSGEETTGTREFSGIYEAQKSAGGVWKITQHIPLDDQNHILSHAVRAAIVPAQRIIVHDDVGISVAAPYGFAVRLNDRAKLTAVLLNGRPAKYRFGGGVFYLKTPPTPRATLSLSYALAAENHIQDKKTQAAFTSSLGDVTSVKVDPEHKLLILRPFGEVVHFALRDPDAKSVALTGNFALRPVTAVRSADTWTLDIPLEEGRCSWAWVVDGKPLATELNGQAASGVRVVQPLTRLPAPYPK